MARVLKGARVVVTGGAGFIGSNLVHELNPMADVTVIDPLTAGSGGNAANLAGLEGLDWIRADLANKDTYQLSTIDEALEGATHIFHCASRTSHSLSMQDPQGDLVHNVMGTLSLFEALREKQSGARVVLTTTTSQVGHSPNGSDEDHAERPQDIYSAHKSLQEKYACVYAKAFGLDLVSIRFSNTYGPRAAIHTPSLGFANYFIGQGLRNGAITVYGDGQQLRSLLYVDDVVDALLRAGTGPVAPGEVLQAAADVPITIAAFAEAVARLVGGHVEHVPWPPGREGMEIGDTLLRNERIRERLNWRPRTDLVAGLTRTVEFFRTDLKPYLVIP